MLTLAIFYELYSLARNTQGSASTSPTHAFRNARVVINFERAIGLYHEESIQRLFLGVRPVVMAFNVYYGTAHFVVTAGVLMWMFLRHPDRYPRWRWALACTTLVALVGFLAFPLMPPRLISAPPFDMGSYEDTLHTVGGLWNFEDGAIAKLSNQYAAMPSLHFAWSLWCCLALWPRLRSAWARVLAVAHPLITLVAIVATANHYWLDAVGGAFTLLVGWVLGGALAARASRVTSWPRMSPPRLAVPALSRRKVPNAPTERQAQGPIGPTERETQGPSGPTERETQSPIGPTERETPGPSGPTKREAQSPSGPTERAGEASGGSTGSDGHAPGGPSGPEPQGPAEPVGPQAAGRGAPATADGHGPSGSAGPKAGDLAVALRPDAPGRDGPPGEAPGHGGAAPETDARGGPTVADGRAPSDAAEPKPEDAGLATRRDAQGRDGPTGTASGPGGATNDRSGAADAGDGEGPGDQGGRPAPRSGGGDGVGPVPGAPDGDGAAASDGSRSRS